jgi:cysteine desulfurase
MGPKLPVYLDNHSTTQPDPRVVDAMLPFLREHYGNPASRQHEFGWVAEAAVELARGQVAGLIGAQPDEIVSTDGATESINLAIKGVAEANGGKGRHIVTAVTEHHAVLDTCWALQRWGCSITELPVDRSGLVSPEDVERALSESTILVSIMLANNEIGTIAPIEEIGRICRSRGVTFHTDATQAVGKIPVDVRRMNVDLMSFSAHKMHGPKGAGSLFIRMAEPRLRVAPQMDGGGHERGFRSGTLNVPGIVGFGKAAEIARREMDEESARVGHLRDILLERLQSQLEEVWLNGHATQRLPHNANLGFGGVRADALMMEMKDIAVSSGSACSSASPEPSHVLTALGLSREQVLSSLRIGLGRFTTEEEIDYAVRRIVQTVQKLRVRARRGDQSRTTQESIRQ